jgi:hypothetical protein
VGCRYAAPALLAASALAAAAVTALGLLAGWPLVRTVVAVAGSLIALQGCYLAGVGLTYVLARKSRRANSRDKARVPVPRGG